MNEFLQSLTPIQTVGILLGIAFMAHIILAAVLKKVISHVSKTKIKWDDHLIKAISAT